MRITFNHLATRHPKVLKSFTGLRVSEFEALLDDMEPRFHAAEYQRLNRPKRQRAIGGGGQYELNVSEQVLVTVMWLRQYPTHDTLGFLFGVSAVTIGRVLARWVPLLEQAGRDTMRHPALSKRHRRSLEQLVQAIPELAVVVDSFEQRVQRPPTRAVADTYYSGKKKQHTLKSQVAVDLGSGRIVDVSDSVPGPTADVTLLAHSQVAERFPAEVGLLGDLAYVGIAALRPSGWAGTPRRKPRQQPRPPDDVAYNRAFAQVRITVEHTLRRVRCYQAVTQMDRHHRRQHSARVVAVAGLVNRQLQRPWLH